jgi:hypothetical protein
MRYITLGAGDGTWAFAHKGPAFPAGGIRGLPSSVSSSCEAIHKTPTKMNEVEKDGIRKTNSSDGHPSFDHQEKRDSVLPEVENRGANNLNAVFENPLAGIPREQLLRDVEDFCSKYNLMADLEVFQRGALISQSPESATSIPELDETEREALTREHTHKWSQPWQLYFLASMSVSSTIF